MKSSFKKSIVAMLGCVSAAAPVYSGPERTPNIGPGEKKELLTIENGTVKVGIDREMGASITWLSWAGYPKNTVNIHDPGRLIQQSYYAGKRLDRSADGQSKNWNPWVWNPIQGGGVGSWAKVSEFKILDDRMLFSATTPKLWDMPDEEAAAVMRQWTAFEKDAANVVVVKCELECKREPNDRWGPAVPRHQEIPALYFVRSFSQFASYLGDGKWQSETHKPGPPWGKAHPPKNAMACFNSEGQGIAIYSPAVDGHWNFAPHGGGDSADPQAAPCVHIAPITTVKLGPQSTLKYRYWLVVGTRAEIASQLDLLIQKYAEEKIELTNPE